MQHGYVFHRQVLRQGIATGMVRLNGWLATLVGDYLFLYYRFFRQGLEFEEGALEIVHGSELAFRLPAEHITLQQDQLFHEFLYAFVRLFQPILQLVLVGSVIISFYNELIVHLKEFIIFFLCNHLL
jgi:hypothetical protein